MYVWMDGGVCLWLKNENMPRSFRPSLGQPIYKRRKKRVMQQHAIKSQYPYPCPYLTLVAIKYSTLSPAQETQSVPLS